jgi:Sigma-54 interaction domain
MIATNTSILPMEAAVLHLRNAFLKLHERECQQLAELLPVLRLARPNVLLAGNAGEVERTFDRMLPYLRLPMAFWMPRQTPNVPTTRCQTLVVRGVEELDDTQQEQLLTHVTRTAGETQFVTISTAPLLPLVSRGVFLDRLYYQLNVVLVEYT